MLSGVPYPSLMGNDRLLVDAQPEHPRLHAASAAGQRAKVWGQTLGLPLPMTLFALLSVFVTSGSQGVYGAAIWDPVELAARPTTSSGGCSSR
ncbi:hypothetical protein GCM10019016_083550 [Streptomyces prasinosporus]|uniref:Uncharacterized protein n=1 Tax=Streptomyces prasinosporus TaxID=68256 RepID=A0ABP6U2T5_9ACTN